MPEKSVREMSDAERRHHSLSARVFHATLVGAAVLGLVMLLIGLGLYSNALIGRYTGDAFALSRYAALSISRTPDASELAEEVMSVYRGLDGEMREKTGTAEYRMLFADAEKSETYRTLLPFLRSFCESGDVYDVYLAMYDRENSALVYFVDPDQNAETKFHPGEWEHVERTEVERFLSWNGEGRLYDIGNTDKYGWMCSAGVPIRNERGEVTAFVLVDVMLENVAAGMKNFVLQYTLALLLVTTLVAVFQAKKMEKTMVRPLNGIAAAAESYVRDKQAGKNVEEHFARLNIRTGDEIENLSHVMADMERDLTGYEEDLMDAVAEKERIGAELALAAGIQAHLLPNIFPPFPDRDEFAIFATMEPAKEVGGDFYDFFMVGEDHLAVVVADVSGKGVPAALFSMIAKTMLKTQAQTHLDPALALSEVNASLSENNEEDMFVTAWLGILRISTGELTYADAGHEKLLLRQDGVWRFLPKNGGAALAMFTPEDLSCMDEKYRFRNNTIRLGPGDAIFQYTDGVTEAADADNGLFGDERLLAAVNGAPSAQPEELLPYVRARIEDFVRGAPQFDDITMLSLQMR